MKYFVFRNSTIEPFFSNDAYLLSGYDDISNVPEEANGFIWFYLLPIRQDLNLLANEVNSFYSNIELLLKSISPSKSFFIFTLSTINYNNIEKGNFKLFESINEFNSRVIKLAKNSNNVKIIDFQSFTKQFTSHQLIDWKYYYLSKMILNPKLAKDFKDWFSKELDTIQMKRKKCLILDLDNTLWGGILGEDGISGIKIGGDYPGNAFQDFQKVILELYKAGVIISICSKNNEQDVLEAWEKNQNILIRKEHIALYRINWNNKAENIAEIISHLNIGADSVVFIDDNPTERELVRQFIPAIESPDFPMQPYMLPVFINDIIDKYFKIYQLTIEDKEKTKQYQENIQRDEFQKSFVNFDEYLTSLKIKLSIQEANPLTIARIAQMTQKTNQFNLTTRRYTESDIYSFVENRQLLYILSVNDRFGDYGITGLIIIKLNKENSEAEIDSFLLSCRILGKSIEVAFFDLMMQKLQQLNIKKVKASYIKTAKNEQVKGFYEKMGFTLNSTAGEDSQKTYELIIENKIFETKPYYIIIE